MNCDPHQWALNFAADVVSDILQTVADFEDWRWHERGQPSAVDDPDAVDCHATLRALLAELTTTAEGHGVNPRAPEAWFLD